MSLSRRRFLTSTSTLGAGLALGACSTEPDAVVAPTSSASPSVTPYATPPRVAPSPAGLERLTAADFAGLDTCRLLPEQSAGPFFTASPDRADLREDREGTPLRVAFLVQDADCQPVPGAVVELWHADHTGDYSAFVDGSSDGEEGPGSTFLRGHQRTDDDGVVEFTTIFPGWYPGRAVHFHLSVLVDDQNWLTTQLYFADEDLIGVFSGGVYAERGMPDVPTSRDGLAGDVIAQGLQLTITEQPDGGDAPLLARHVLGIAV